MSCEDLCSLFEAARWAPSSYNEQPWSYIVATRSERAEFERLLSCLMEGNQAWACHVPVLALGITREAFTRNGKPNAAAQHDLGLASENLVSEATTRGLCVHQMIGIVPDRARELYGIPEDSRALTGIGGTRTIKIDVRLVAATNRDLVQMVDEHRSRDDLYYRLNVFPIYAPPLRERAEDIEPLVRHFAQHFAARMQGRIEAIPTETLDALRRYTWPGNVRELENLIERAVILSAGPRLTVPLAHLARRPTPMVQDDSASTLKGLERAHVMRVLEETNWILGGLRGAAARLGMKRTTLQSLMKRLAIARPA